MTLPSPRPPVGAAPAQAADKPMLGIALVLCFCLLAPLADALAKILSGALPVVQLALIRFAAQVALLLPLVLASGAALRVSRRALIRLCWRAVMHIAGIVMMFEALKHLPLADAVAIAFVMPFILLILGKAFLNEDIGPRRIWACAVGFGGTLLVIQPSFASVGLYALLPVGVAFAFAFFMLITRTVAKEVDPMAVQVISGAVACVLLLPAFALGHAMDWPVLMMALPPAGFGWHIAAFACLGTLAHLTMSWSLRFAPAATLAPIQYLEIPIAAAVGFAVFRQFPNGLALIGIAIVITAGLYVVYREHHANK
ncbi:DMT family transporter [Alphaproteobacteria bacterium KMM 3653]|uniref:DMT family transporter n=1 Tax=Harenicola maris TaxID=2841044 RepID=A0AAP2CN28_9RHOB|nr:DMT family transporter [Harenicola maris]